MGMPLVRGQLNRVRTLIGTIKGRTGNENGHGQGDCINVRYVGSVVVLFPDVA